MYLNFIISRTLGLKISKSLSLNPTHWDLFNNIKSASKFPYNFLFWFKWIFSEKVIQYSITFSNYRLKHYETNSMQIYSSRAFHLIPRVQQEVLWYGRSRPNKQNRTKQNKRPCFRDRYEGYVQKSSNDISSDLNYQI